MSEQTGSRRIVKAEVTFEDGSTKSFTGRGSMVCYSAIQQREVHQIVGTPKTPVKTINDTVDILQASMLLGDFSEPEPQEPPGAEEG